MPRTYSHLTSQQQDEMRAHRVQQLEAEHYSNTLALEAAMATASAVSEEAAVQVQADVERLEQNLVILDASLDALEA